MSTVAEAAASGSFLLDVLGTLDSPGVGVLIGVLAGVYLIGRFCSQCPLRTRFLEGEKGGKR